MSFPLIVISNYYLCKSFVDDLIGTGYCTCESGLVPRSTEIQPLFYDLFFHPPFSPFSAGVAVEQSALLPCLQVLVIVTLPKEMFDLCINIIITFILISLQSFIS